jgi:hypothetical protein
MTLLEKFNKINPLVKEVKKDGFILEIREKGYFIILPNGKIHKKGIRMSKELKQYFEV